MEPKLLLYRVLTVKLEDRSLIPYLAVQVSVSYRIQCQSWFRDLPVYSIYFSLYIFYNNQIKRILLLVVHILNKSQKPKYFIKHCMKIYIRREKSLHMTSYILKRPVKFKPQTLKFLRELLIVTRINNELLDSILEFRHEDKIH